MDGLAVVAEFEPDDFAAKRDELDADRVGRGVRGGDGVHVADPGGQHALFDGDRQRAV